MWQALRKRKPENIAPVSTEQDLAIRALEERCEALSRDNKHLATTLARFSAGTTPASDVGQVLDEDPPLVIDEAFHNFFKDVLLRTFYKDNPFIDITNAEVLERDVAAHVEYRFRVFEALISSWLKLAAPNIETMTALEIGSGTGSSTLAFARQVKRLISFEIDDKATAAAQARIDYFGISNVEFRKELFNADSDVIKDGRQIDMVVLCAVLEHMTLQERTEALQLSWEALSPGGLLVVTDTPNRLAVFDDHTSLLPHYSALSPELQREYAKYSPRKDLVDSIERETSDTVFQTLTRWGSGISYHDFEVSIGREIHDHIVLDGYEPSLLKHYPDRIDDALQRIAFQHYAIPAHRAFTRHNLHFVARKPNSQR